MCEEAAAAFVQAMNRGRGARDMGRDPLEFLRRVVAKPEDPSIVVAAAAKMQAPAAMHQASASADLSSHLMHRALLHLMNRQLSRGWSAWHSTWSEVVRKRAALRRSLSYMLNRNLSRGWGAWVEMVTERAEFMQKLRRGLAHLLNRHLSRAWGTWGEMVAEQKQKQKAVYARGLLRHEFSYALDQSLNRACRTLTKHWPRIECHIRSLQSPERTQRFTARRFHAILQELTPAPDVSREELMKLFSLLHLSMTVELPVLAAYLHQGKVAPPPRRPCTAPLSLRVSASAASLPAAWRGPAWRGGPRLGELPDDWRHQCSLTPGSYMTPFMQSKIIMQREMAGRMFHRDSPSFNPKLTASPSMKRAAGARGSTGTASAPSLPGPMSYLE